MKGRKPTPTILKLVRGNPGKRPILPSPVPSIPLLDSDLPAGLTPEAGVEWRRVLVSLTSSGVVTGWDRGTLVAYCVAWGRWVEAERKVAELGTIVKSSKVKAPIQNPYLAVANAAMLALVKFAAELGMTPSARSRVSAKPPKEASKLEKFTGA